MHDHTSLRAWQKAAFVAEESVFLQESHWRPALTHVFSQLSSAALSVRLNIAEGHALQIPTLQRRHYRIAFGSIVETIDLLRMLERVAKDIPATRLKPVQEAAIVTRGLVLGLIRRTDRLIALDKSRST